MQTVASTRLDVVPTVLGRWDVLEPGGQRPLVSADSEEEAVGRARQMMKRRGGEVRVRDSAGVVARTETVSGLDQFERPWWFVRTSALTLVLSALFVAAGVGGLLIDSGTWWNWLQLALGLSYLALFVLSRRWEVHKLDENAT